MSKYLRGMYVEWLEVNNKLEEVINCEDERVRENFSRYAGMETIISSEEMEELIKNKEKTIEEIKELAKKYNWQ